MLTNKETKTPKYYDEDRAIPAWSSVLLHGLAFSILVVVITMLSDLVFKNKPFESIDWHLLIKIPVATFLYGFAMRWLAKHNYNQLKKKEPLP